MECKEAGCCQVLRVKETEDLNHTQLPWLEAPDARRVRGGKERSLHFKSRLGFLSITWGGYLWLLNWNCVFLFKVITVFFPNPRVSKSAQVFIQQQGNTSHTEQFLKLIGGENRCLVITNMNQSCSMYQFYIHIRGLSRKSPSIVDIMRQLGQYWCNLAAKESGLECACVNNDGFTVPVSGGGRHCWVSMCTVCPSHSKWLSK